MKIIITGRIFHNKCLKGYRAWYINNNKLSYGNIDRYDVQKISNYIINCKFDKRNKSLVSIINIPITEYPTYLSQDDSIAKLKGYTDSDIIATSLNISVENVRIKICGALISGAIIDPNSKEATKHARLYYEEIRHRRDDILKIANNTGYTPEEILRIKNYLFMDMHDLETGYRRFDENFHIAQSWQRLSEKDSKLIKPHDFTLIKHEILEMSLIDNGMNQNEAHIYAEGTFNYRKESDEYYDKIRANKKNR